MTSASDEERKCPSMGIVVPVYNEADGIERALREIAKVADVYPGPATVIAVDDGSADASGEIIDRVAANFDSVDAAHHATNAGYGAALRTGAERAQALSLRYVAFIDSDLTNPPSDLLKVGELARAGHPYIKASRYVTGGGMVGVRPSRRFMSRGANMTARALFRTRVHDVTNGFRAMRTDLFLSLSLREPGFALIVEEFDLAQRKGIEPVEFASTLGERTAGQRPTAFAYSPGLLMAYMRYPLGSLARRMRSLGRGRR